MEGIVKSFLDFFKLNDDEDEDYIDDGYDDEPIVLHKESNASKKEDMRASRPARPVSSKPKVVPMRQSKGGNTFMEYNLFKPTCFEDSQDICNMLLKAQPVIIVLEGYDSDEAQRIMDFVSGCVYAINGKITPVTTFVFLVTPENSEINSNILEAVQDAFGVPTISKEF